MTWIGKAVVAVVLGTSPGRAGAAAPPPSSIKIDARLEVLRLAAPADTVAAWVEFIDKGERDPRDLAARLAQAERALSPRNRARRLRAGVRPLVDALDLPVDPDYLQQLRARGFRPFAVSRWFNRVAVRAPAGTLGAIASLGCVVRVRPVERALVMRDPGPSVRRSEQGLRLETLTSPSSTMSIDYGLKAKELAQLDLPAVHDSGYVGQGVLICMLDDGFYHQDVHQATKTIAVPPGFRRDFVDGDTVVTDLATGAHGMWTLSCIGGNLAGTYVGAAYGATFALARTENDASETPQEMYNWGNGAEWADSLGADLISSSLGYLTFDGGVGNYTYADLDGHTTVVSRAAEIAAAKGMLVVNAVGNSGYNGAGSLIAPADVNGDSLLAAGAVDSNGVIAGFSSRGPTADGRIKPDLCTRGVDNWLPDASTVNGYLQDSGTSFSTPLLAGVCACIMSARPQWNPQTVIRALRETASRFSSPGNTYGYGIVDALAALRWTYPLAGVPDGPRHGAGIALVGENPVRPGHATRVRFALGDGGREGARASVAVVDLAGRTVRTLWSGTLAPAQEVEAAWIGDDAAGRHVLPGVYWITLSGGTPGRSSSVRVVSL